MSTMSYTSFKSAALASLASTAIGDKSIFLIGHAETIATGAISPAGMQREQCLIKDFGNTSGLSIEHIIGPLPQPGVVPFTKNPTNLPYLTCAPLASSLNLSIETKCQAGQTRCAAKQAEEYSGNVLVCWDQEHLANVSRALGGVDVPDYSASRYDLIYNQVSPYTSIVVESQHCKGIDLGSTGSTTVHACPTISSSIPNSSSKKASTTTSDNNASTSISMSLVNSSGVMSQASGPCTTSNNHEPGRSSAPTATATGDGSSSTESASQVRILKSLTLLVTLLMLL